MACPCARSERRKQGTLLLPDGLRQPVYCTFTLLLVEADEVLFRLLGTVSLIPERGLEKEASMTCFRFPRKRLVS
jgi:hypothetical protein